MRFPDTRSTHKQHVDRLIQEGQAGQLAHARGREAGLKAEVELLQRAQHRETGTSNARVDGAIGFIGEFQFDQPSQVGGEAGLAFGGPIRFRFEGSSHAVQTEFGQLALEHAAFGLGQARLRRRFGETRAHPTASSTRW
jgi:hypothetical protein